MACVKITKEEMIDAPYAMTYRAMLFDRLEAAGFNLKMLSLTGMIFEILDDYRTWHDWDGNKYFEILNVSGEKK